MQMGAWALLLAVGLCIPSTLSMVVISKSSRACNEDPLVRREDRADVIVTGLVDKIVREPRKAMYKCEVKVVRVFKGAETLHNGITPVLQEDKIMVGGFGDPNICSNTVLEGDTKILLLGVDSKGHLSLNSSLLTITYNNLEIVEGAVHDMPVITKPPLVQGACDRILCTFGAYCQEMEDGSPKCICPDHCEGMTAPVCGTDRVTYQSECHMKVAACEAKQLVTVLNQGECVDPCEAMSCGYGEICQIVGLGAECVCNTECEEVYEPVCGSNGRDYDNKCTMMMTSCSNKKNITAVFDGLCDPCKGVEHEEGTVCRLDENRNPVLECTEQCSSEYSPVCGSDGMMYNNTCQMEHAACIMNMEITEVPMEGCTTDGPCTQEPCEYGHCSLSTSLEVTCTCPSECQAAYSPVCANDGVTYGSMCEMERTACLNKENLMALYHRQCEEDIDPCSKIECGFGATCTQVNGLAECTCEMTCMDEVDMVCGSDRVTYSNPCEVRRAICLQQTEIEITSMGRCDLCEDHVCGHGSYCVMEGEEPTCRCVEFCNANYRPVCGSDGITYSNLCNLRTKSCTTSQEITVVSEGPCDLCLNVNCTHGSRCRNGICKCKGSCPFVYNPVCASDGQTYDNECKMNLTMCKQKIDLTVEFEGECELESGSGEMSGDDMDDSTVSYSNFTAVEIKRCDETTCGFGGVCVPDGMGMKCSCNMSCPAIRMAVCGSDGATYGNKCQLKKASCEQQKPIVMELGTCEDVEQEPCDGETPLMESGMEIKCTEENGGDECPSGSYCHIHSQGSFAVCCPEEATPIPEVRCEDSEYGCCPDGETAAEGESYEGCEERVCDCNDYGAYDKECDANGQCSCRPGVIGELCNSCSPGYWNFRGIVEGNEGCEPCDCNVGGSLRDDCDQNYGSCICKAGVTGMKCDKCPAGQKMGAMGCENDNASMPLTCAERMCDFGADCVDVNDTSICVCPSDCPGSGEPVCGSDDQTYSTECQLRVISCRSEKVIFVKNTGVCETSLTEPMMVSEDCEETQFGCCPDGVTEAMGENLEGCAESTTIFPMVDSTEMPSNTTVEVMGCASSPCRHGGTCMDSDVAPGFVCHCPLGKGGPVCMKTVHFDYPLFSGNSYIAYDTIKNAFMMVRIVMEFQVTESSDSLLLYNGQKDDGSGDFIALVLVDNHVELRFDLGSREVVVARSNVMIEKDTWYRVVASRSRKDGEVSVDKEPVVVASASSGSGGLHLVSQMYLGNVAEGRDRVFFRTGVSGGFSGCVRHLKVNNQEYNLKYPEDMGDMLFGANIADCGMDPCEGHGCLNNATCTPGEGDRYTCECVGSFMGAFCGDTIGPDACLGHMCHSGSTCVPEPEGSYRCDCPAGFKGDRCDQEIEPEMSGPFIPAFGGNSFIELPGMKMSSQHKIEVEFYTSEPNGMIFYQGQKSDGNGDFISVNLVEGFLELRYDLGSGPAELRTYEAVNLNEWISIVAIRDGRDGSLEIVDMERIEGTSKMSDENADAEGDLSQLNLNLNFFVGGVPDFSELSRKAAITDGLTGAVRRLALNGEEIVDLRESAIREVNIDEFIPDVCLTHPCMEGFLCEAETGDCVCPEHLVQDGDKCVSGEMTMAPGLMTAMDDMATDTDEVDMATDTGMDMMTEGVVDMVTEEVKEMMTDRDLVTEAEEDKETQPMMAVSDMAKTSHKMTEGIVMDYTDVDETEAPGMMTHTEGMAPQMTTPKRMVISEGPMPTKSEMTPPAMDKVSPGMSSMTTMTMDKEDAEMETEEGTTSAMMMKTSKLMSTLHKMSQMMDTKKPMDMVTTPKMETAKMTPKGMTPTASKMQQTGMSSEQSHHTPTAAAMTTVKKGTAPLQNMTKLTMGTPSFPPPPPMTTTAPPRTTAADARMATTKRMTTEKMDTTKATTAARMPTTTQATPSPKMLTTQATSSPRMPTTQATSSPRMTTVKSSTNVITTKATTPTETTSVPSTQGSAVSSTAEPPDIDSPVSFTGSQQYMYNNMITKVVRAQMSNVFSLVVRTTEENGLIMWNGGSDFIGLAVIDGYVMFTYQLGSGTLRMSSNVYVSDGNYHRIHASRYIRDGTLQVDEEDPVLAVSKPGASQLNTDGLVYVGGASNVPDKKLPGGFKANFVGCIGDIYIDELQLHMFYDAQGDQPEQFCSSRR